MISLSKFLLAAVAVLAFAPSHLIAAPALRVRMSLYQLTHNQDPYLPAGTNHTNVKTGTTRDTYFTLENIGDSTLNFVAPTTLFGDGFAHYTILVDRPASILPGQSASMVVRYQPNAAGEHEASISLTSNAPNPVYTINFLHQASNNPEKPTPDIALLNLSKQKKKCNKLGDCKMLGKLEAGNNALVEVPVPKIYIFATNPEGFAVQGIGTVGYQELKLMKPRKSLSDPVKIKKQKLKTSIPSAQSRFVIFIYTDAGDVQYVDNFLGVDLLPL